MPTKIDNKVLSVIGDKSDLICIRCKKARKMRMSAYCLKCKIELEPTYLEKQKGIMKSKIKSDSRCFHCGRTDLVIIKNRRKDYRVEYKFYCPDCKSERVMVIEPDCCEECGESLPEPVREDRGSGHSELITY